MRQLTPETLARLRGWAERYDAAVRSGALPPLVDIGQDMAAFLDEGDRWLDRVLSGTIGEIALDIAVSGTAGGARAASARHTLGIAAAEQPVPRRG